MSLWGILTGRRALHVLHLWLRWAPLLIIVSLAPAGALAQATRPLPPFNVNIAQKLRIGPLVRRLHGNAV
jgi:hypothetical protein